VRFFCYDTVLSRPRDRVLDLALGILVRRYPLRFALLSQRWLRVYHLAQKCLVF